MKLKGFGFSLGPSGIHETYYDGLGAFVAFCDVVPAEEAPPAAVELAEKKLSEFLQQIPPHQLNEEGVVRAFEHANRALLQQFEEHEGSFAVSAVVIVAVAPLQQSDLPFEILIAGVG